MYYDRSKFALGSHRTSNYPAIMALQVASWVVILLKRTENDQWPHVISDSENPHDSVYFFKAACNYSSL